MQQKQQSQSLFGRRVDSRCSGLQGTVDGSKRRFARVLRCAHFPSRIHGSFPFFLPISLTIRSS
jgi:hypothetical protein